MIKELLEGKPFGHPLHPMLVHFPIGLFILSLLFDLAAWLLDAGNVFVRGAFYTMLLGVGTALLAAIPGLVDRSDIRDDHPAARLATTHMVLNLLVVGIYVVNLILRYGQLEATSVPLLPIILSLLAVGILSYSGYLGGSMVYNDGIGVGRHRRHTETPETTLHKSSREQLVGYISIGPADSLGPGETLRVEVDEHVMTVANVDGEYYAFQEFCTHRFGPLSEGDFENYQIRCPWHRSCFDVRTGKVTQGPAKIDLKTYDVIVQDGQIQVRVPEAMQNAAG